MYKSREYTILLYGKLSKDFNSRGLKTPLKIASVSKYEGDTIGYYPFYLLFSIEKAATPQEAKAFAEAYLTQEGFCSSGRFVDGPGDYFDVYQQPWGSCWPENTPCPAIISEAIYDSILKHLENTFEEEGLFADVENQPVSKQLIGTKWIVFVSYHN